MQVATHYIPETTHYMERALSRMPVVTDKPLPTTLQEIRRYVEQLLSPKEQAACDMATD